MCAHIALHAPFAGLGHDALAPAWQPAHPCPEGVGHLVLHHQTATRLFLGALVHDAVVVVVLRLGGELLMQHPAHRGQVRQPQRVVGYARLHDGLPLFFHHLSPAVLLRPAAQVQAEVAHRHRGGQHLPVRREYRAAPRRLRPLDILAAVGLLAPHVALHHLRPQRGPQHAAADHCHKHQVHPQHLAEQSLVMLFLFQLFPVDMLIR